MYITFCIFGFLLLLVCIESFIQQKKREEDDLCEKAERAIAQLQRLRKDTLKKAEIYFYLPEDNLWRVALQTAITMTEDTLHAVHETLGRATEKKRK
ncbi:hypothetical protein HY967_04020, partial [Candidatus Jorgensenbacteria bacterium]|nr:hypothetical protein [Candidatus Jorgensenbacteria bacterium]